ncbi:MAG: DNA polymerase domain-containing protein [Nitrososphaerales archaeon]
MEGWILDIYPSENGGMVIWLKQRNGKTVRLIDKWSPSIYVCADDFGKVLRIPEVRLLVNDFGYEDKIAEITDKECKKVLRLTLKNARDMGRLARIVYYSAPYDWHRIYNADIDPVQTYMYEHDLFPLALINIECVKGNARWHLLDSVESIDYELPVLKEVEIRLHHDRQGVLVKPTDRIKSIELLIEDGNIVIEGNERDVLLQLVDNVREIDPDIIYIDKGDSFVVPSLLYRAHTHGISSQIILGRDKEPVVLPKKKGSSYYSYGKVIYRPRPIRFHGRVHVDTFNTFVHAACGLNGLIEVARTCRVPLDTTTRASIGRIMTSIEFYHAYKDNILIPWKPTLAERFKSAYDLMVGDRGGFIFEPKVGVHDNVGEIDFSSLYPTLMLKKNISAETVACDCCPDSHLRVPELNYNICEKRIGIIPKSLDLLIQKRARYKELKKSADGSAREIYDARQTALKWVLVSCFGYLGFRNAKFGRIDAHMAVCAFARKALFDALKIAEGNAYEIVHGIVDSLWLKKRNASEEDYLELCSKIRDDTGLPISFEGIYKWIAFLPSKMYDRIPVLNRYFGVFKNGEIKIRGIEARKHDTPEFIRKCQMEMLQAMSRYSNAREVRENIMEAVQVLVRYVKALEDRQVPIEDLIIHKQLSKDALDYRKDILQAVVARQLFKRGRKLNAGESISYLITDYQNKNPDRRAVHADMIDGQQYDVKKYSSMLIDASNTILQPFNVTGSLLKEKEQLKQLLDRATPNKVQEVLTKLYRFP